MSRVLLPVERPPERVPFSGLVESHKEYATQVYRHRRPGDLAGGARNPLGGPRLPTWKVIAPDAVSWVMGEARRRSEKVATADWPSLVDLDPAQPLIEAVNSEAEQVAAYLAAHAHKRAQLPQLAWNERRGIMNEIPRMPVGITPELCPSSPKFPPTFYTKDPNHPKYTGNRGD